MLIFVVFVLAHQPLVLLDKQHLTAQCVSVSQTGEFSRRCLIKPPGELSLWGIAQRLDPLPAESHYLNFHRLEGVRRYRDPQLQASENYSYLFNFRSNF